MQNKFIGRGLKDLLNENNIDTIIEGEQIVEIDLEEIKPNPFQPRRIFHQEKIDELAQSIKEHGVFQPIILKKVNEGYIIVSGERRYRACKQLKKQSIPAIVRFYDEEKVAEIALIENLQREDLTPIEEAEAYRNIMVNLDFTHTDLAVKVGKSRSHITNMLGLLNLPEEVQNLILENKISMGHARVLSKLVSPKRIKELANLIIERQYSVRQTEELAKIEKKNKEIRRVTKDPIFTSWEKKLNSKYDIKVKVNANKISIDSNDVYVIKNIVEKLLN